MTPTALAASIDAATAHATRPRTGRLPLPGRRLTTECRTARPCPTSRSRGARETILGDTPDRALPPASLMARPPLLAASGAHGVRWSWGGSVSRNSCGLSSSAGSGSGSRGAFGCRGESPAVGGGPTMGRGIAPGSPPQKSSWVTDAAPGNAMIPALGSAAGPNGTSSSRGPSQSRGKRTTLVGSSPFRFLSRSSESTAFSGPFSRWRPPGAILYRSYPIRLN
jgi:hypothetical protein